MIDGKLQLKQAPAANKSNINKTNNVTKYEDSRTAGKNG